MAIEGGYAARPQAKTRAEEQTSCRHCPCPSTSLSLHKLAISALHAPHSPLPLLSPPSSPLPLTLSPAGLFSALLGSFPSAAIFWTAYETSKVRFEAALPNKDLAFLAHGAAAGVADIAVCAVRNPFEVVKQQMQAGLHSSTRDAFRTIVRLEGYRGLYAGYLSTVLREIPFDAVQFAIYEHLKGKVREGQQMSELVLWQNAILGSIAGGVAAACTTPLDVIKTRLMTQTKASAGERYKGWWDAASRIHAEEGWQALFSGIKPRVAWISLGGAIFLGSFEEIRRQMGGSRSSTGSSGGKGEGIA